jgi:hypothetical protein
MEPYHPGGYKIKKNESDEGEYSLIFKQGGLPVPEELQKGKEVEVQIDDQFQIFGHYKHPVLDFDNNELDIKELLGHHPKKITIWY